MKLTPYQLDRISRVGEQWSLLWDKRRRLWIAAEDDEDGEQIEDADLDVLLDRLTTSTPRISMDTLQEPTVPDMPGQHQALRDQASRASQHLTAIAARLADHGIASSLTCLGGTPVLTIEEPAAGPNPAAVSIDPDTSNGPGLWIDCTCLWTPSPGTPPEATADTIRTVLNAIRPGTTGQ